MFKMKRLLVVNADDFGYCQERNKGIVECFLKNAITSASIMVNAQGTTEAFSLAKHHNIPIGLHFNITEGTPLSPLSKVKSLVNSDGFFLGKYGFRNSLSQNQVKLDEVALELEAQLDAFQAAMGEHPLNVDGHQHVHILPGLAEVFATVVSAMGVKTTRLPVEYAINDCAWIDPGSRDFCGTIIKQAEAARETFRKMGIRFTDSFVGMATMGCDMNVARLSDRLNMALTNVESAKFGHVPSPLTKETSEFAVNKKVNTDVISCELMVHPGYPSVEGQGGCGEGPDEFSRSHARLHEIKVLMSDEMQTFYMDRNITLGNFGDILACN